MSDPRHVRTGGASALPPTPRGMPAHPVYPPSERPDVEVLVDGEWS